MDSNRSTTVTRQSIEHIQECLSAISLTLSAEQYSVIGGAALIALGPLHRTTEDIDILVNTGSTNQHQKPSCSISQLPNGSQDSSSPLFILT